MDAIPAGPACPNPRKPLLSIVVPVRNGGRDLELGLRGVRASTQRDFELIVVDDGSTDDSAAVAERFGARVIRLPRSRGPAAARNRGVREAAAPIILFLDADVVPHPETFGRVLGHFERDPGLVALFGSYDDQPRAPGLVSRYRNLLHHYVHQDGAFVADARPVRSFWTGCGAIRRAAFLEHGGFDPVRYRRPAIEDIEFGHRLAGAGLRLARVRDVQVTHLKRWSFASMLKTDIFQRGVPWMLLLLRSKQPEPADLNIKPEQRACVAATGLGLIGLAAAPWGAWAALLLVLNLLVLIVVNRGFYRFLIARRGWRFTLGAFPLHYVYYLCCGLSVAIALGIHAGERLRKALLFPARHALRRGPSPATEPTR